MTHLKLAVLTVVISSIASAQDAPGAPVHVRRTPPADALDFDTPLKALRDASTNPVPQAPPAVPVASESTVPAGFKPKTDVQLAKTAEDAVEMSSSWMAERNQPAAGRDGRVLYSFGAGLPTVVCAPLRVCMIELQAGEKLVGEPHIGDSVRWILSPASYGSGAFSTSVIVLKPQSPGLDTNLLITTDRRAYYLRLLSKPEEYVARVAFAYPEDEDNQQKWQQHLAEQKQQQINSTRIAELPPNSVDGLFFKYRLKGGNENIRPVRVFDDGKKTYIQIGAAAKNREAPVLVVIGPDGKQEMVNYRVKDDMYIVDRLFERAELILGSGKKALKVEITRERKS